MAFSPEKQKAAPSEALPSMEAVSNLLQIELALLRYAAEHTERTVDIIDPQHNDDDIRREAMMQWVVGDNSPSVRFRTYLENGHAGDVIDLRDVQQLQNLLNTLDIPSTLH